jgi:mRNA interferase MazF
MSKDFDGWNEKKKIVDSTGENKFYHTREIWWCKLGLNVGYEQDGKDVDFQRPVLVLKSFGPSICLVVPLTTSTKEHKYRIPLGLVDGKNASAIISQIKVIDTKRFVEKVGFLDIEMFSRIQKAIKGLV